MLSLICTVAGYLTVSAFVWKIVRLIYHLLRPPKNLSNYGDWSIVTGATDGIGKAIAFELARKNQNLLLIGRNLSKLESVRTQILDQHSKIEIEYCELDLSLFDSSLKSQNRFLNTIANKNIGILINNAGVFYHRGVGIYFHKTSMTRINDIIKVNNLSLCMLTHMVINQCFLKQNINNSSSNKHKQKLRPSAIVNISSGTSLLPSDFVTVYGSSKNFLNRFSLDLDHEYNNKEFNIACQTQICGQVITKMLPLLKQSSMLVTTTDIYAKYSVKHIGYGGMCSPYPPHAILFFLIDLVPRFVLEQCEYMLFRIYEKIQYF